MEGLLSTGPTPSSFFTQSGGASRWRSVLSAHVVIFYSVHTKSVFVWTESNITPNKIKTYLKSIHIKPPEAFEFDPHCLLSILFYGSKIFFFLILNPFKP